MAPFADIALAISGPRGSGRTYNMITNAPDGATILTHSKEHAVYLREEVRRIGRHDLMVHVARNDSMKGMSAARIVADHYAIECWFMEASMEIGKLIAQNRALSDKLEAAEAELQRLRG